jgi:hypothetical protein
MSGISLNQYGKVSTTNQDGLLEKTGSSQPELYKGTLGQRIGSFFRNIGVALGFVKGESRVDRQEKALTGFKESIKREYGRDTGNKTLHSVGVTHRSINLKGSTVTKALDSAHQRREARITDNESLRQKTLDGSVLTRPQDVQKLRDLMDGKNGESLKSEYDARLKERFAIESNGGRKPITPEQAQKIAREELTKLSELNQSGKLELSGKVRGEFNNSIGKVVSLLSQGADPKAIQGAMDDAMEAMTRLVQTEGGKTIVSPRQMEERVKAAIWLQGRETIEKGGGYQGPSVGNLPLEKRTGMGNSGHESLVIAQKNGLSERSSLRKIYRETTKSRLDEKQGPEGRKARLTQAMLRGITGGLGDLVGSLGRSSRDDSRQFSTSTNRQGFGG